MFLQAVLQTGIIRALSETSSQGPGIRALQGFRGAGTPFCRELYKAGGDPGVSLPPALAGEGASSGNTIACRHLGFRGRLVATSDLLSQPGAPCSPAGIRQPSCAPSLGPRATGKLGFTGCLLRKPGDTRCAGGPGSDFADRGHLGAFQISREGPRRGPGGRTQPSPAATRANLASSCRSVRSSANAILPEAVTCGQQHRASPRTPKTTPGRYQVPWTPSSTRGEAQETFPRGSEQGIGGRWVPGRVFPSGPVRSSLQRRRIWGAQPLALRHGLEVSAVSCGLGARGAGAAAGGGPRGPSSAAASSPVLTQLSRKTSELARRGPAGGRHARRARGAGCREERGMRGGGAGACALRPCHIGMSRSAERRRRRRLRRSAGGGGRGELPAAPLRGAQQEGGRERASAGGASGKSFRAGGRKEGKKERKRAREGKSERLSEGARENSRQHFHLDPSMPIEQMLENCK
ncbi:hypothetical protein R6Z07F_016231 [Ovis aries]